MSLQQIADLKAESDEFDRLLAGLREKDWSRATQFKGWTINDIVQHLHMGDLMSLASATDPAGFSVLLADVRAARAKGLSRVEETRQRLDNLSGRSLRGRWRTTTEALCEALATKPADARLKWAGPDMGVRMFTTARQMEVWSHAQAIYDLLGIERPAPSPRLRNIAEIGVRTFGWAYRNRGLPVPEVAPHVRLGAPLGETWEWNAPPAKDSISGDAVGFCQVVTQTRNIADTRLAVAGDIATHWMSIAQCFAGPPETPPAKGARHRSMSRPA
jgi:uncharacterized protein (TIGR03084 family)